MLLLERGSWLRREPANVSAEEVFVSGRYTTTWTLNQVAKHAVTEDLPLPENRVTVDKAGTITIVYHPSNEEPKKRLYAQLRSMLGDWTCTITICCPTTPI